VVYPSLLARGRDKEKLSGVEKQLLVQFLQRATHSFNGEASTCMSTEEIIFALVAVGQSCRLWQ